MANTSEFLWLWLYDREQPYSMDALWERRGSRQTRTSVVFMTLFYCLKMYNGGGGVWKSQNLSIDTLWMVPSCGFFSIGFLHFLWLSENKECLICKKFCETTWTIKEYGGITLLDLTFTCKTYKFENQFKCTRTFLWNCKTMHWVI